MIVNNAGLDLIKAFEGFRATAYRCPAGVWTIGYGHTSMAGPPDVKAGMRIGKPEAARILRDDVEKFAAGIELLIRKELNSNQFSALVSFAFNVGVGAFRGSSVLKAVNAGDFDSVPRRLALWNKGGGRVLAGLVRRRAAEGALFMAAEGNSLAGFHAASAPPKAEILEMDEVRGLLDVPGGKSMGESTTVWATVASGGAGIAAAAKDALYEVNDFGTLLGFNGATLALLGLTAVIIGATIWIIKERRRKALDEGV